MPLVYYQHKLKHNGICTSQVFEGYQRKMHNNSLANLYNNPAGKQYCIDYVQDESSEFLRAVRNREIFYISEAVSKKIADKCRQLSYFSGERKFISKKSGVFKMKVAFITLTAPDGIDNTSLDNAFRRFLEYLHRTANCEYVYKKELGSTSKRLHYHILVNNFIPYYIVNWKWSKLLANEFGKASQQFEMSKFKASTRIEMPRSKKAVQNYISKYMGKMEVFYENVGRLWGCSESLKNIEFPALIENDISAEEWANIYKNYKTISKDYMVFVCCDCLSLAKIAPIVYATFRPFFDEIRAKITREQRFTVVESQLN